MLTYQVRRRTFRHEPGTEIVFPNKCVIRYHFGPDQAFGTAAGGGRTAVQSKPATVLFDANTGAHTIESAESLHPLDVTIEAPGQLVRLRGTVLEVEQQCETLKDLDETLTGLYSGLPVLLNVDFADPPVVRRVDGEIGGVRFRWELSDWRMQFRVTNQDVQEQAFVDAMNRLALVGGLEKRRLLAALHYFHVAVRLARSGQTPGEFMAEVVLNLSKTLEVLFPPGGSGETRDAVRTGLRSLGYSDADIEKFFIPSMILRNEIDVGHVSLVLFTPSQLTAIHKYTEVAEEAFQTLLRKVLLAAKEGRWSLPTHASGARSPRLDKTLRKLQQAFKDD